MSFNLLDIVKDQFSDSMVNKLGSMVGESEGGITKALSGLIPTVVGTLASKASDEKGATGLIDMIKSSGAADMNPDDLFGDNSSGFMDKAGGLVSGLFGGESGGIIDKISSFAGLGRSSSSSLLGIVSSMAMGALGKHVIGNGITGKALSGLLGGQSKGILGAIPGGLGDLVGNLGLGKLGDLAGDAMGAVTGAAGSVAGSASDAVKGAAGAASGAVKGAAGAAGKVASGAADMAGDVAGAAVSGGKKAIRWILPLLLVLAVASYFGFDACNAAKTAGDKLQNAGAAAVDGAGEMADKAGDMAGDAAGAVGDMAGKAMDAAGEAASDLGGAIMGKLDAAGNWISDLGEDINLSFGDINLTVGEKSSEANLYNFLNGSASVSNDKSQGWYNLDRVFFQTGSANLTEDSKAQLSNIASILKNFPNANLKLGGYTDNTGNEAANLKLSQSRADAAMAQLVALGIDASRLSAEGYGIAHPRATNDTPEGRAQNRRVAFRVTAK